MYRLHLYDSDTHEGTTQVLYDHEIPHGTATLNQPPSRPPVMLYTSYVDPRWIIGRNIAGRRCLRHLDFRFGQSMDEPVCHGDPRLKVFRSCPISPVPLFG